MKSKAIFFLFLVILTALLPGMAGADDAPATIASKNADRKKADAAFVELANERRAAVLKLSLNPEAGQTRSSFGAFISTNGLALVPLAMVTTKEKPTVVTADGKELKFGSILSLLPEQGVALMKFDHQPEVIVPVTKREPELDEDIALILPQNQASGFGKIPPVLGPIVAKRRDVSTNLKVPGFLKFLSLGSGLSFEQRATISGSCFAINDKGEYVGGMAGINSYPDQSILALYSIADAAGHIDRLANQGIGLKHPLPDASNPLDPAMIDPDYMDMEKAMMGRDSESVRRLLEGLLKRYPQSIPIRMHAATSPLIVDPEKPLLGLKDFPEPDPNDANKAHHYLQHTVRSVFLRGMQGKENKERAIREMKSAIGCSPIDSPKGRAELADVYLQLELGRDDEAELLYREAYPYMADTITFLEKYESLLTKTGKHTEAGKVNDRIYELSAIYRARRGEGR